MSRLKILFRPPLVAAIGGLLLLGPMAGKAQDKPRGEAGTIVIPPPERDDSFRSDQPFPWPSFLGVRPAPGRYRSRLKIVEFSMDEMPELNGMDFERMMRESMEDTQTYCIRGDEELEDWAAEIGNGNCESMTLDRAGDGFSMHMVCRPEADAVMDVSASGNVSPTASRMMIAVTGISSEFGDMAIRFAAQTERLGDCE
mgnify:CR=1 FL=1